jgi:hypothetical protein
VKDMTGLEIEVGDDVVYAVGGGGGRCDLVSAIVKRTSPTSITVLRTLKPKGRLVTVRFPERCRVVGRDEKDVI